LLLVAILAALVFVLAQDKTWRALAIASCGAVATLLIAGHFLTSSAQGVSESVGHAIGALFFVLVAGKIVWSILTTKAISWDTVFGAICGYLLLGVAWGLAYAMVHAANPESFQLSDAIRPHLEQPGHSRDVFVYYSFVTLTTVGYGDVAPISIPARTLSWVEAVVGQLYVAVLIAGLISGLVAKNMSDQRRR
jgi:voltage-gated potassium channel